MCIVCAANGVSTSGSSFSHDLAWAGLSAPAPLRFAATGVTATQTGVATTDALIYGLSWSGPISYSFPTRTTAYEWGYAEAQNGFAPVSFAQMQAARYVLEGTSRYLGGPRAALTFVEGFTLASLTDAGFGGSDIRIAQSRSGGETAYAYLPSSYSSGGDIWFGRTYDYTRPTLGTYSFMTMAHELGHALGLKHAHEAGGLTSDMLPPKKDSLEYSVMTYRSYVPFSYQTTPAVYTNEEFGFPQTFMMYDIAALQSLYGANFGVRSGNTVYRWDPGTGETFVDGVGMGAPGGGIGGAANRIFLTIWDGGGIDTFDFSNYGTRVWANLAPGGAISLASGQRAYLGDGHYARANIFNALLYQSDTRSLIENAYGGAGHDVLKGNAAANRLKGNAGNDVLWGMGGRDVLIGGPGADTFVFSTPLHSFWNVDRIVDFNVRDDTIRLAKSIFSAFPTAGALPSGALRMGALAEDLDDRILYDRATGILAYDRDAIGPAAAIRFARLPTGLALTDADFVIV